MAFTLPALPLRMTDANGNPISGAKLYIYQAGTLTPVDSYTTSALSVANTNPVVASAAGVFPPVWLQAGDYKFIYTDASDVQLLAPIDNYTVEIEGSQLSYVTSVKTANFTVVAGDRSKMFLVDASGALGTNILIIADSDSLTSGFPFIVVNTGATGTVTVQGTGGQTVDGSPAVILVAQNSAAQFVSKGALGWQSIAKSGLNASITDVLNGTNTALAATPESLAGLWKRGVDVVGDATITLGDGGLFHVTGNNWTCSDIDFAIPVNGRAAKLIIDGTGNTFTHSADLVCPDGRDLKLNAGDIISVTQDNADRVILQTASALPAEWVRLSEFPIVSGDIIVPFDVFAGYADFKVIIRSALLSVGGTTRMTFSNDNGATYLAGTGYSSTREGHEWTASTTNNIDLGNTSLAYWVLTSSATQPATSHYNFELVFYNTKSTLFRPYYEGFSSINAAPTTGSSTLKLTGFHNTLSKVDKVKIFSTLGGYNDGTVIVMGRR